MKYDEKTVRQNIMNDPTISDFRQRILAKTHGEQLLEVYVSAKTFLKNNEAELDKMDVNDSRYQDLRNKVNDTRKYVQEAEQMVEAPQNTLEKVMNVVKTVTVDPVEKGIDVVRGFLSAPDKDEHSHMQSQKPSLWDVFFK